MLSSQVKGVGRRSHPASRLTGEYKSGIDLLVSLTAISFVSVLNCLLRALQVKLTFKKHFVVLCAVFCKCSHLFCL